MSKPKLLIVDDMADILDILQNMASEKWDVKVASSFKDAIRLLRTENFDLVITDFNMPDCNGLDILDEARACGVEKVFVHSSAIEELSINQGFDLCFDKLDKKLCEYLKAGAL